MAFALQEAELWSYVTGARKMPREIPFPSKSSDDDEVSLEETPDQLDKRDQRDLERLESRKAKKSSRKDRQDVHGRRAARILVDEGPSQR